MITVETEIEAPVDYVWMCWTEPAHITQWNFASEEWHCPAAINDLCEGGELNWRMEARDGSEGFDFVGTYGIIEIGKSISYTIADGRKVSILFSSMNNKTTVTESFEAEHIHSPEEQRAGWQSILENFKRHVESIR